MKRNPVIQMSLRIFIRVLGRRGISQQEARKVFIRLGRLQDHLPVRGKPSATKRARLLDSTPNLTQYLCDKLYRYQLLNKAFGIKRITPENKRHWRLAVRIKKYLFGIHVPNDKSVIDTFILGAYKFCNEKGKKRLPIVFINQFRAEIFARAMASKRGIITPEEKFVHEYYWEKRSHLTGEKPDKLSPGSASFDLLGKVVDITKDYNVSIRQYIDIQFKTFAFVNTFPTLYNLTTERSRDRIAQAIAQGIISKKKHNTKLEDKYWDEVRRNITHKRES